MVAVESLLAARLFLSPQLVGDQIYFISNLSGRLSLYRMPLAGGVPEPLLLPNIALQNPDLVGGYSYAIFPTLDTIVVSLDDNGDENYRPMRIPLDGGFPAPLFDLANSRVAIQRADRERGTLHLAAETIGAPVFRVLAADMSSRELRELSTSEHFGGTLAVSDDGARALLVEGYTTGDTVLREWHAADAGLALRLGTPLAARAAGETPPLLGISAAAYVEGGAIVVTTAFDDCGGLALLEDGGSTLTPLVVSGAQHSGVGELVGLEDIGGGRYLLSYNIDGCSWLYVATLDLAAMHVAIERALVGAGELAGGTLEAFHHDPATDRVALSFSSATSPTQLFVVDLVAATTRRLTSERVLGLDPALLAPGEDASFTSHDGLRVSARLYLPSEALGFSGPRPLVYYVHGGPQGQERPDFAWFSMPLIQLLTLRGFAVFVPNVRGSTGYGLAYTKWVDRDWGGQDRLDHVHAMGVLAGDARVDTARAGVVGRSYGGYMTLTLAARHPELWRAAVDMFGPYDLAMFIQRLPETWKPYFYQSLGHPERDAAFLAERSPASYMDALACPLLVIQGANDPRVTARESQDVVDQLRATGKQVELLLFADEGHDVLKYANRVACYSAIADFFVAHLTAA